MGPAGTDGLDLAQDARALVAHLTDGATLQYDFGAGRGGYLYVIDGRVQLAAEPLRTGDAAQIVGPVGASLTTDLAAELILIDVPLEFEPVGVWAGERAPGRS
jgi:redox-sensitive bicupin YhaK (pirin superfamily)